MYVYVHTLPLTKTNVRAGPEDGDTYVEASKELQEWMDSDEDQKGKQLFKKIG